MLTQNQIHIFLDSGKVLHPEEGVWSLIHLLSSINKFYISKILLELIFLVLLFPDILLFFLFVFLQFYLQDTKSSNGTFINSQRLSRGSEESPPCEIMSGDIIQFGVDVTENTRKGKGMDHFLVSFQVYLFRTSYYNTVFKTKWHSHCKKIVLFGWVFLLLLPSFLLTVSPVPMWYQIKKLIC